MIIAKSLIAIALAASLATPAFAADAEKADAYWVYIGAYTGKENKGIQLYRLDLASGSLTRVGLAAEVTNPSFLAIHPSRRFLYAAGEIYGGAKPGGLVSGFAIDPATGKLTLLNQQSSGGQGPCHLVVDAAGKNVLVANYGSGAVAVLPIGDDGRLAEPSCIIQHQGKGPDPKRQQGPHAHSINLDAANQFAFAADLGLDKVFVYRFDPTKGALTPNQPAAAVVAPGAGPRHFAFHPTGRFAYVINEMASTVTAFSYDAQRGALTELQTIPTLPADFKGQSTTAEVQVHPSGKFLYGSNRGHDSIAIFSIDQQTGRLTSLGQQPSGGKTPRNFGIDPTGSFLIAAHQGSNNLTVFRISAATGLLEPVGSPIDSPLPVCVKFLPIAK